MRGPRIRPLGRVSTHQGRHNVKKMPDDEPAQTRISETGLAALQAALPGLARLMPEIADRWWRCNFAARAGAWTNSQWQLRQGDKLLRLCAVTRPKYKEDLDAFMEQYSKPLHAAIASRDLPLFNTLFDQAVQEANRYHESWNKAHIQWALPETPPPGIRFVPDPLPAPGSNT